MHCFSPPKHVSDSVSVKLLSFYDSHIDVEMEGGEVPFRFIGMYGTSDKRRKHEDWELLNRLKSRSDLPWLLGGDLNDILDYSEKDGRRRKPMVEMENFKSSLVRNDLWDIKPNKGWFTWHYGEDTTTHIKERLDRFVASIS
ncbi:hypothetical protein GQ457_16G019420 [Hibiscus cannabinus]